MKLIFFSDLHGNGGAFDSFMEHVETIRPDLMVFCGDIFGYYYDQQYILDKFRGLPNIVCIAGNHDRMFLNMMDGKIDCGVLSEKYGKTYEFCRQNISEANIKYVRSWPEVFEMAVGDVRIGAFHGSPMQPLNGRIYPDTKIADATPFAGYTYVVCCHTHHRLEKIINGARLLNPGSLGQPRDGAGCSFLELDTDSGRYFWHVVAYDRERLRKRILKNDPGKPNFVEVLYRVSRKCVVAVQNGSARLWDSSRGGK